MYGSERIGARRLLALLKGLPSNSALHREVNPDGSQWTTTDELLALLIEVVDHGNRLFFSVNSKKGTKLPDPIHVPRPWEKNLEPEKPQMASTDEVRAFFGGGLKRKRKK